jgi:hypothetical protein
MVHGSWFMVHGSWFMVHGTDPAVMQAYLRLPTQFLLLGDNAWNAVGRKPLFSSGQGRLSSLLSTKRAVMLRDSAKTPSWVQIN